MGDELNHRFRRKDTVPVNAQNASANTITPTNPSATAQQRPQTPRHLPKSVTHAAFEIRDLTAQNPTPNIPKSVT